MDYSTQFTLLLATMGVTAILVGAGDVQVFGVIGGTVKLECNVPVSSDEPDVEWIDRVWGSEEKPEKIFSSRNNPNLEVRAEHQNKLNFQVTHSFTLTIINLNMDTDVGQYTCRSRVGNDVHKKHYYLTIGELPKCSGNGNLRSGERTSLTCEMSYSGNKPVLDWHEDEKMVKSIDEYDIRVAKKVVEVHASHRQDGAKYRCQMTLGSAVHECHIMMNVTYTVHAPKFHPDKPSFHAGEELKCVAKGNPTPTVTFDPNLPKAVVGRGWVAVIVDQSWEGKQMAVKCSALNRVDGVDHTKWNNISFSVSAPTTKKPELHQHSTVPAPLVDEEVVEKKDAVETHQHQEPANQHSDPAPKETSKAVERPKSKPQPKPDVKAVKSNNSAGNRMMFTTTVLLVSVLAALWI